MATTTTKKAKRFRKGDRVEWNSHGGKTTAKKRGVAVGTVLKKLTAPMTIKGHRVAASTDEPQYLVRSDNGGKAAHQPSALRRSSSTAVTGDGTKATKAKTDTKTKKKTKAEKTKAKKAKAKKTKK